MIRKAIIGAGLATLLAGCLSPAPPTGFVAGLGTPSDGYEVTFIEGTQGYAYWCRAIDTCTSRAATTCGNAYTIRDISEIDPAQSPDTRDFFQKAASDLETFAVTCDAPPSTIDAEAIDIDTIDVAPLDAPDPATSG